MTQTAEVIKDPVEDLARILEGYEKGDRGMNSHYAKAIAQTAIPIRDMYRDLAQAEGIHNFFNEIPNISELAAYTNYLLATDENSDLSTRKHVEHGRMAFATEFLGNYIETATRRETEEDAALRDNLYWVQCVGEFFDEGTFQATSLRIGYDLTHNEKMTAYDAAKMVDGYLKAVEFVYKSDELSAKALEDLKARAKAMGKSWKDLLRKEKEGALEKEDCASFYDNVLGLKSLIDKYAGSEHKKKNSIIKRDLRAEMDTPERREVLLGLDKKVTEHLENTDIARRAGKVFELLRRTWPYMQRSYNPADFDLENINLSHAVSGDATPYQREIAYIAVTHSDDYKKLKGVMEKLNARVIKRVGRGEKREAAALSELARTFGKKNPEDEYSSNYALAGLFPVEKIGTFESDDIVAEALGIDKDEIEKKLEQYATPETNGFWDKLSRVGKFFTRKVF
jgi:hypothetical protein